MCSEYFEECKTKLSEPQTILNLKNTSVPRGSNILPILKAHSQAPSLHSLLFDVLFVSFRLSVPGGRLRIILGRVSLLTGGF